ncbi:MULTISPECIES: Xaa-Pro peptidase family protein [unclassified Mycolicibacterium]|uniref:M24 family metallopeptidase n=1 Tax=unclassified Mycolicibacterium TaxID=2636767 RepID=UPI00130810D1|nr:MULTISPECIES: M24 family metallopeptidase [unclassified Mycolicibacterium]MUL83334.1 aminopeptidase P family protein [Mycolicibacterium sp. CBMA 329]MUL90325.1 aminopeptidase P family protein [Mycolicibacterium sp. CBMA 331]MUM00299.1 aminopeptidase P family protein [Mycolicibacterium sp. CBMA 334]MUM26498.1 aminopeptidase P family protein [Mycolicibacterium sp. CBMA 295]MUM41269.1 aminopeptidase P family protein [Mycolicibacterium sp. CBMA 247]
MGIDIEADGRALRFSRRERALAQMEAYDLDVLVLGRQANVRYISGAPQLWVVGTRPFGPICTFVRDTGEIHLNSTWDEGIPEEIPHENLYGFAWNPMTLIGVLQNIKGADTARRVGTDALTPTFAKLLPMAFPNAELVDGEQAMRAARRIKTHEEIVALRRALAVAEEGLAKGVAELCPGITEKFLAGAMLEAEAAGGVSTPATQDAAWVTSKEHPWRRAEGDDRVREGDLVALSAGVLADGYVGEVTRTVYVGEPTDAVRTLYRRRDDLWDRLLEACRPGKTTSALLDAYEQAGERLPAMPVAHGLGLGFDPPVVSPNLRATAAADPLEEGMVLAVTAYVWEQGVGAVFTRDAVLIGADGPQVLTQTQPDSEAAHA